MHVAVLGEVDGFDDFISYERAFVCKFFDIGIGAELHALLAIPQMHVEVGESRKVGCVGYERGRFIEFDVEKFKVGVVLRCAVGDGVYMYS